MSSVFRSVSDLKGGVEFLLPPMQIFYRTHYIRWGISCLLSITCWFIIK